MLNLNYGVTPSAPVLKNTRRPYISLKFSNAGANVGIINDFGKH